MIRLGESKDTNATYGATLIKLGKAYPQLVVLEADLMKASGGGAFQKEFPDRLFNLGIAEQDALGFAAGLASMGSLPFVSGFACFVAQRSCDQAVNSIAYNRFNVKIVGTSAGLTSEKNGGTHISIDDLSIYRAIPNFTVVDPGDATEFAAVLDYAAAHDGPMYIRSNKGSRPTFLPEDYTFTPGKAQVLSDGDEIGLITTGITTLEGIKAVEQLAEQGISVRHVHMASIKPVDREELIRTAKMTKLIITVENQSVIGGLGSAVTETLSEAYPTKVLRLGLQDHFGETARLDYMMHKYGIDAAGICACAQNNLTSFR